MMQSIRTPMARATALVLATLALAAAARAEDARPEDAKPGDEPVTIEHLLKSGWQIAGYASNADTRSTFILFKHPSETYLVQCLAGYDVTRTPRIFENCYPLK
jgi:hypothetical protein